MFGRLAPGATQCTGAAPSCPAIAARLQQQYPDTNKDLGVGVMTFNERFNGGQIRSVFLALMGAVGFVLLIACANVANLLLARSSRRTREVAVRVALGAGRGRIIRQLLVESTLLACVGGLLGLGLSYVGIGLFDAAVADVGKPYWIRFTMDYRVFGFMALVCLATGLLFGLAPALQVSRTNVNEMLKEGGRGTAGGAEGAPLDLGDGDCGADADAGPADRRRPDDPQLPEALLDAARHRQHPRAHDADDADRGPLSDRRKAPAVLRRPALPG